MKSPAWLTPALRLILVLTPAILVCPLNTIAGMTPSEVRVVLELVTKADQGDPVAQFQLGRCYAKGQGVEKDLARAVTWYRKATPRLNSGLRSVMDAGRGWLGMTSKCAPT